MTPERTYLPVAEISSRADGYGMRAWSADGNDVSDVHAVVTEAVAAARTGDGPALIEVFTYRMHGHGAHDAQKYLPTGELDAWRARDPLLLWRGRAEEEIGWSDERQAELEQRIDAEVSAAVREALEAPYPDPAELGSSLFA
jgi:pyruvate dehydrogenase E1 component alpha subunit